MRSTRSRVPDKEDAVDLGCESLLQKRKQAKPLLAAHMTHPSTPPTYCSSLECAVGHSSSKKKTRRHFPQCVLHHGRPAVWNQAARAATARDGLQELAILGEQLASLMCVGLTALLVVDTRMEDNAAAAPGGNFFTRNAADIFWFGFFFPAATVVCAHPRGHGCIAKDGRL